MAMMRLPWKASDRDHLIMFVRFLRSAHITYVNDGYR